MAKLSEKYETTLAFSVKNGEEQVEALKEKFKTLIEKNTTLIGINEWGKRRLAYPIDYETEAHYIIYSFDCKPDFPAELERVLGITEGVLRFLTVLRNDAPPRPVKAEAKAESSAEQSAPEPAQGAQGE